MAYSVPPPHFSKVKVNTANMCNLPSQGGFSQQQAQIPHMPFTVPPPPLPPSLKPTINTYQQFPTSLSQTYVEQNLYSNIPDQFTSSPVQGSNYPFSSKISHFGSREYNHTSYSQVEIKTVDQTKSIQRLTDEKWLKDWLSRRDQSVSSFKKASKPIKVFEGKLCLQTCITLLQQLEVTHKVLSSECKSMSPTSWKSLMEDVEQKMNIVSTCLLEIQKPNTLDYLKKTLVKRQKKRQSQKRRREVHREIIAESHAKRQQLHRSIDIWLEDMQVAVEKAKTEESLKKEADTILSDVTRKKAEARRQVALLSALVKLRQLRVKSAASRGQHISVEGGIRFNKVADHLQKLWSNQLKEYNLEEQGLQVMLSEAVDERDQTRVLREKRALAQWEQVLFGRGKPDKPGFYLAAEQDLEAFINIRQAWDKFVAPTNIPMSSAIPIGWVLPTTASSSQWEAVLSSTRPVD